MTNSRKGVLRTAITIAAVLALLGSGLAFTGCDLNGSSGSTTIPDEVMETVGGIFDLMGGALDGFDENLLSGGPPPTYTVEFDGPEYIVTYTLESNGDDVLTAALVFDGWEPEAGIAVFGDLTATVTADFDGGEISKWAVEGTISVSGHPDGIEQLTFAGALHWDPAGAIGQDGPEDEPTSITGHVTIDGTQYSLKAIYEQADWE